MGKNSGRGRTGVVRARFDAPGGALTTLRSYGWSFGVSARWPRCHRKRFTGDLAHGLVEGQAEHLDMEVDSVAGEVALRPAPVD